MIAAEVISPWTVYWITRLTGINGLLLAFGILACVAWGIVLLFTLDNCHCDDEIPTRVKPLLKWLSIPAALMLAFVAIPSTKEACAIYLIPKIANNESVQEIGVDIKTLAREWLEELRPAGKKTEPAKGE